jgi:hypothetical protein
MAAPEGAGERFLAPARRWIPEMAKILREQLARVREVPRRTLPTGSCLVARFDPALRAFALTWQQTLFSSEKAEQRLSWRLRPVQKRSSTAPAACSPSARSPPSPRTLMIRGHPSGGLVCPDGPRRGVLSVAMSPAEQSARGPR